MPKPSANGLPARLNSFRVYNDLTWLRFAEKLNGFLISSGRRPLSDRWLRQAAAGFRVSESVTFKLKSFLEAQGF